MTRPRPDLGPDLGAVPGSVVVRAAAKVNLHLGVGRPREDGFHPLATVFHAIGLYDDVAASDAEEWQVDLRPAAHVDAAAVPAGADNLVRRAADLLAAHAGVSSRAALLRLSKEIPVAGGMAGGSADAAATLVALDRLWDLRTSDDDLLALAAALGSDVPFALLGGTAHGRGRGERVEPLPDAGPWWWVVVPQPGEGLSTPAVYRRFDDLSPDAPADPPPPAPDLVDALGSGDADRLGRLLHNDLQAAALDLRPGLADVLAAGEEAGASRGLVSGSGPTCVFLCGSADHARAVAADLAGRFPVVLVAPGPVAGCHVVDQR